MSLDRQELDRLQNNFYRDHYRKVMIALMVAIFLMIGMVCVVIYLIKQKPSPLYYAKNDAAQTILLNPLDEPNLLPDALLRWASQAAVAAYSFDFANIDKQMLDGRPYFTDKGWRDYLSSLAAAGVVATVKQNQLFVNSVVAGPPVIVNQGPLDGVYTWRVQLPLLVTFISANSTSPRTYLVNMLILRVPTTDNIQGIGIDLFAMH